MIKVVALVTLYDPNKDVVDNLQILGRQVDRMILCDNSMNDNAQMFCGVTKSVYTTQHKNLGLTGAFNSILEDSAYGWEDEDIVVFFDQDSRISEGYISSLCDEYQRIEAKVENLGCLGPIFYNTSNGQVERPRQRKTITADTYIVSNTITSSLMTRYKNLKKIGFWNENIFLDMADWDLCWRMEKAGLLCCMTEKVTLHHSVGNGEKRAGPIKLRVGQPFREYYQTRDALYLLREEYVPLKLRLRLIANITIRPLVHFLFLNDKALRMKYIRRGIYDYRKGIHGEYEE
mgnify:CR=1 FL=1